MKFKIPFSFAPIEKLKKKSNFFTRFVREKENSKLTKQLEMSDLDITGREYTAICLRGMVYSFLFVFVLASSTLVLLKVSHSLLLALGMSVLFSGFVFFSRRVYPKVFITRKQREIEGNILSALQDVLVQLTSGIPLFSILVNISSSDYGALSEEFKKIVRKINAGIPQSDVLEEIAEKNPSLFFRRALWQISNGMRAGSDISIVIKDSIKSLNEEQLIQIQNYGNKLNPSIMFYMLMTVILPALAITFLTIISSLINLNKITTMSLFGVLFVFVVFAQFMFLGVIKSIRPSLL
ncbi:MAG: type II secretion system F family protein [Nanoarchaeota archaeon]|nr:type II secretion system F family protein [Nanoarchaeota archaeon]MBU1051829.1 type II secretion system F family protein [Nanoarchaeota archaeon]MBU1988440.1 type II secretion system F family protein [Nanoarchaeota archaeon]